MEELPFSESKVVRLSQSPAGSPRLVEGAISSARSVHLDAMGETAQDKLDDGMRTTGFFEDSFEDGNMIKVQAATPIVEPPPGRGRSSSPRKEQGSYLGGTTTGDYVSQCADRFSPSHQPGSLLPEVFLKLTQTPDPPQLTPLQPQSGARPPEATYENEESTPVAVQARPISFQSSGPAAIVHHASPRASTVFMDTDPSAAVETTKDELRMNAHTQALQALLRDESGLQTAANLQAATTANRISFIPDENRPTPCPPTKKHVSLAPPPLDVSEPRNSISGNIVRTPYPFNFRRSYPKPSPLRTSANLDQESFLPLSIRQREGNYARPRKTTHLTIPVNLDAIATVKMTNASPKTKEEHFDAWDFDDAHFFNELRNSYITLAGPFRFFSARTLQRIQLSHSVACSDAYLAESGIYRPPGRSCAHSFPHSPRFLESGGLADSFSEAEVMRYYRHRKLGKARYAWVHWAHRLASTAPYLRSPAPVPPADSPAARVFAMEAARDSERRGDSEGSRGVDGGECAAGLEFVEGWSALRISIAMLLVMVMAVTAALCWVFLGTNISVRRTGYRDAGERVEGGMLVGVFVLLIGWTGILGWLGMSWLVSF